MTVNTLGDTVGGLLHDRAGRTPGADFRWTDGEWITDAQTVEPSDRLAVYACSRLRAIQVPLNTFPRGEFSCTIDSRITTRTPGGFGRMDENGFVYFVDRKRKRSGTSTCRQRRRSRQVR